MSVVRRVCRCRPIRPAYQSSQPNRWSVYAARLQLPADTAGPWPILVPYGQSLVPVCKESAQGQPALFGFGLSGTRVATNGSAGAAAPALTLGPAELGIEGVLGGGFRRQAGDKVAVDGHRISAGCHDTGGLVGDVHSAGHVGLGGAADRVG